VAEDIFDPAHMTLSLVVPNTHPMSDDEWIACMDVR